MQMISTECAPHGTLVLPRIVRLTGYWLLGLTVWFSFATFAFMHFATDRGMPISILFAPEARHVPREAPIGLLRDFVVGIAAAATNGAYAIFVLRVDRWDRRRLRQLLAIAGFGTVVLLFWCYMAVVGLLDFQDLLERRYHGETPALGPVEFIGLPLAPALEILVLQTALILGYFRRPAPPPKK